MLQTAVVAVRDRARLQEIVGVLLRFGLADLVEALGLRRLAPLATTVAATADDASRPQRVRQAIEQLGPTFVKLGQILATRADLLGPEWTQELEKLHSQATPVPWDAIAVQINEDLGAPVDTVFKHFEREPLASASMAQVYRARLADDTPEGRDVVVKVQRPGLRARIEADLRLLSHLAALLEDNWPALAHYQPREVARQAAAAIRDELDFTREGHNGEAVAAHFAAQDEVVVPRIAWEWSSERLLVQDYLPGTQAGSVKDYPALDGPLLAQRGAHAFLQMVLRDGLFHGDPHPGNLVALAGNRVGFLDFGLVGRLSARRRDQVVDLLRALVEGQSDGLTMVLLEWSGGSSPDLARLDASVEKFVAQHGKQALSITQALQDVMALARDSGIVLPADLALLFKAIITADGVLHLLDPDFDVARAAEPLVREHLQRRYSPKRLLRQRASALAGLYDLAADAPQTLRLLMYRLRQGRVAADIEVRQLDRLASALERAATRLALAVVAGAFILGLAPRLMAMGPVWFGIPLFPALGLLATCASIAALVVTLRRPARE
ncbi:AarF/UbiB family protein [Xylophilus sp. GW821-FHT01B05]